MKYFLKLTLTLILLTIVVDTSSVQAQQSVSLGVFPPLLEVEMVPGKSITQVFKIYNQSEIPLILETKLVIFEPKGEKGEITLKQEPTGGERNWFSFLNKNLELGDRFNLPAQKSQEAVLVINLPSSAPEGDYYYTLLAQTVPEERFSGNSIAQVKIGANVLLTISKGKKEEQNISIASFRIKNTLFRLLNLKLVDSFSPPQFEIRLENKGRHFLKPQGEIKITDTFGQEQTLSLLEENILTQAIRQIDCQESPGCQLKGKFFLGVYKAQLITEKQNQEIVFISLPFKLILGLIGLTGFLLVVKKAGKLGLDKRF